MAAVHEVSENERNKMIADAAYFRAEHRGFEGGDPVVDWLEAEAEVDARLGKSDGLLERFQNRLASLDDHLKAARRKVAGMKTEAREEWEEELETLAKTRQRLRRKLTELRKQGLNVKQMTVLKLEAAWEEASEVLQRLDHRLTTKARGQT